MWSGSVTSIPIGYALYDGLNGTPNLTGRFIRAADDSALAVGDGAGSFTSDPTTLTIEQIPNHSNGIPGQGCYNCGSSITFRGSNNTDTRNTYGAGGGGSHWHSFMPEYYALAYIMKI